MTVERKPQSASTVVLLRRAEPKGFEVLLTRRPEAMAFLGGMYCFPGGKVRQEDCSPALLQRCRGLSASAARRIVGTDFSAAEACGYWTAAIRELFEEAGVLLAINASNEPVEAGRLAETHAALARKSTSFASLLEREGLYCNASSLVYFSHWQTPAEFAPRFDTRFFLAALPQAQRPLRSSSEVAHSLWLSPDRALQLFEHQQLPMIFPTFASLRALADFDTLESVFKEYRAQAGLSAE
ncbi:MAG TPA: NUDIX hydrolase [Candidatus Binatia bacterium]|nr:NUDIX hydrolase [Candidatus Binatia bacterium]